MSYNIGLSSLKYFCVFDNLQVYIASALSRELGDYNWLFLPNIMGFGSGVNDAGNKSLRQIMQKMHWT